MQFAINQPIVTGLALPVLRAKVTLHTRFAAFLQARVHYEVRTWLGMFGAATPKCVKLISSDPFVKHLVRKHVCKKQARLFSDWACVDFVIGAEEA